MNQKEITKYSKLNELSKPDGTVIFGGNDDQTIPLCELKQAFSLDFELYNRSFRNLSIKNSIAYYDTCIASLVPETILLHIGENDLENFTKNSADFDQKYRNLISHIKSQAPKCRIAIISQKNPENDAVIAKMNQHLKYIADSEQCEFGDISNKRVWNPKETMDVISFVYSMGFVRPLKNRRPIYDLVKILFCFE